jgi:hypothetical protein
MYLCSLIPSHPLQSSPIRPPIRLCIHLSIHLFSMLFFHLAIYLSIYISIYFVFVSRLSIRPLSTCLSICLCGCVCVQPCFVWTGSTRGLAEMVNICFVVLEAGGRGLRLDQLLKYVPWWTCPRTHGNVMGCTLILACPVEKGYISCGCTFVWNPREAPHMDICQQRSMRAVLHDHQALHDSNANENADDKFRTMIIYQNSWRSLKTTE